MSSSFRSIILWLIIGFAIVLLLGGLLFARLRKTLRPNTNISHVPNNQPTVTIVTPTPAPLQTLLPEINPSPAPTPAQTPQETPPDVGYDNDHHFEDQDMPPARYRTYRRPRWYIVWMPIYTYVPVHYSSPEQSYSSSGNSQAYASTSGGSAQASSSSGSASASASAWSN